MPGATSPVAAPTGGRVLVMLRGLPGAGKTTRGQRIVDDAPAGTAVRVGVDDVATMLYGPSRPHGIARVVWSVVVASASAAFRSGVTTVVIDAPNLASVHERALERLARAHEATLLVEDLDVPVEECRRRNLARGAEGGRMVADALIGELAAGR